MQTSIQGKPIDLKYGETRVAPALIWFANFMPTGCPEPRTYDYPFDQRPFRFPFGTVKRMFVKSTVSLLATRFAFRFV